MRTHPARWGAETNLGFVPALVSLWAASWLHSLLAVGWILQLRCPGSCRMANQVANTWLLGLAAAVYTLWIFAVARRWITTATAGGFVIAAHGLILRTVVEFPQSVAQITLSERQPPEPYATVLVWGRLLGLVAYVVGLGFVLAAVVAERRLRRGVPAWTLTE